MLPTYEEKFSFSIFQKKIMLYLFTVHTYIVPELYIGVAACFKSLLFLHDFVNS